MALMTPLGEIRVFLDGEPYPYILKKEKIGAGYHDLEGRYSITGEVIPDGKRHTLACCFYPNQIIIYSASKPYGSDYSSVDGKIKVTIGRDLSPDSDYLVYFSGSHYEENGKFFDTYDTMADAHFYKFGIAWLTDCNAVNADETRKGSGVLNCNYGVGVTFDGPAITGMGYSPDEIRMIDVKDGDSRIRNSNDEGNVIYRFTRTDKSKSFDGREVEAYTVRWEDKDTIRELLHIPEGIDAQVKLDFEGYPFRRFMVLYNPLLSIPYPEVLVAKYTVDGNDWVIEDLDKNTKNAGVAENATIPYFRTYSRKVNFTVKADPDASEKELLRGIADSCRRGYSVKEDIETAEKIDEIINVLDSDDKDINPDEIGVLILQRRNLIRTNASYRMFTVDFKPELSDEETDYIVRLGDECLNGIAFEQDYKAARTLYTIAKDAGNAQAYYKLGWLYQNGYGVQRNNMIAIEFYKMAAEKGDTDTMVRLGGIFKDGAFIEEDDDESFRWYKMAADLGNTEGIFNLAECLDSGRGTDPDRERAFGIFKQLADSGKEDGAYYYVGSHYAEGSGTEENNEAARIYFQKGADAGDPRCWGKLAEIYLNGLGVESDPQKALSCFCEEARLGDPTGYTNIGWMYETGKLGEPDTEKAMKYYGIAASMGEESAKDPYACLKAESEPYETDREKHKYYYGELSEETLASWDEISDPFKILTKKKAIEPTDRHDYGWQVGKFADKNFTNKRDVEEYGSWAYQCTGAQLKQMQKETGWIIPGISRVLDDKIYGLVYIGNPEPPKIERGFSDYWIGVLAEAGYTPESARDYVVEKLRKANVREKTIDEFLKPVDQLEFSQTDTILEMALWHKDEPEAFMKLIGRDLSNYSDYITMLACWD